jgi:hypothetical protein
MRVSDLRNQWIRRSREDGSPASISNLSPSLDPRRNGNDGCRRFARALLSLLSLLLPLFAVADEPPPRLAVIPYLALNLTPSEESELREQLSIEIASNTKARVLPNKEVQKKLPPIPDGCPENPDCVLSVGTPLSADYLLFVALVKTDAEIQMQLFLVEVAGAGAMRQDKKSLPVEESAWGEVMAGAIRSLVGGVKRLAQETALTPITNPSTQKIGDRPPKERKAWPWILLGSGIVVTGAAAGTFVALYPFTTLGSFGPGAAQ